MIQQQTAKPSMRRATKSAIIDPAQLLKEAVEYALKIAEGNVQEAAQSLMEAGLKNVTLRDAINEDSFFENCLRHISVANRANNARRRSVEIIPSRTSGNVVQRNQKRAETYANDILMTTIWGFGLLKDAKKADVLKAADHYGKQGRTMLSTERWLKAIAKIMDTRKTVGSSITRETLIKLKAETVHA